MKVVIYARVSKEEQYPENQIKELKEYCQKKEWQIYDILWDKISGRKGREDRVNFDLAFKMANQRKYDLLLVWALDRFTREGVYKTMMYIKQLDEYGVAFKSYQEEFLDTSGIFKDVIIALFATMAELESIRKSERIKAGLERTKKRIGRKPISDETKAKIKELKDNGWSYRQIAEKTNVSVHSAVKYGKKK